MSRENDFSEVFKRIAAEKEMSQRDIASACGMTQTTISRYMSGKRTPNIKAIRKLASVLGVSPEELFSGAEEEPSSDTVDYASLCRIISSSRDNLTERQKVTLLNLLFDREIKTEDEDRQKEKEVFNDVFQRLMKLKEEGEIYDYMLSDINRSLDTIERKTYVHILSQGVFRDNDFVFPMKTESPVFSFLHRYNAVTSSPNDYFLCRQKEDAWTVQGGYTRGDTEIWEVYDVDRVYKSFLPDDTKAQGHIELSENEEGNMVFSCLDDCKILVPYKGDMISIPYRGKTKYKNTVFQGVSIDILKDKGRFESFLSLL